MATTPKINPIQKRIFRRPLLWQGRWPARSQDPEMQGCSTCHDVDHRNAKMQDCANRNHKSSGEHRNQPGARSIEQEPALGLVL